MGAHSCPGCSLWKSRLGRPLPAPAHPRGPRPLASGPRAHRRCFDFFTSFVAYFNVFDVPSEHGDRRQQRSGWHCALQGTGLPWGGGFWEEEVRPGCWRPRCRQVSCQTDAQSALLCHGRREGLVTFLVLPGPVACALRLRPSRGGWWFLWLPGWNRAWGGCQLRAWKPCEGGVWAQLAAFLGDASDVTGPSERAPPPAVRGRRSGQLGGNRTGPHCHVTSVPRFPHVSRGRWE